MYLVQRGIEATPIKNKSGIFVINMATIVEAWSKQTFVFYFWTGSRSAGRTPTASGTACERVALSSRQAWKGWRVISLVISVAPFDFHGVNQVYNLLQFVSALCTAAMCVEGNCWRWKNSPSRGLGTRLTPLSLNRVGEPVNEAALIPTQHIF